MNRFIQTDPDPGRAEKVTPKTLWMLSLVVAGCAATPAVPDPMTRAVEYIRADLQKKEPWADLKVNPSDCYDGSDVDAGAFIADMSAQDLAPDGHVFLAKMGSCGSTSRWYYLLVDRHGKLREVDPHVNGDITSVHPNEYGQLEVNALVFTKDDPPCCPSKQIVLIIPVDQ